MNLKITMFILYISVIKNYAQSNEWTWEKGSNFSNTVTVGGTLGIESSINTPGGREHCQHWTQNNGNLWLFGGQVYGSTSIATGGLWRYNPVTNSWAAIQTAPNTTSIYGTIGIANVANCPSTRYGGATWKDNSGNFWLYSGQTNTGVKSDLWKYDPVNYMWTFVSGDTITDYKVPNWGTKGIESSSNTPGGRLDAVTWYYNGFLYLFGGKVVTDITGGEDVYNDLWKYNISNNKWTWINGDNYPRSIGNFGLIGSMSATNKPNARHEACSWTDVNGIFWLFGGYGFYLNSFGNYVADAYNDVWKYDPSQNSWAWVKGSNTFGSYGNYGIKGIETSSNNPPARGSASSFITSSNNFWLFGGNGNGFRNDLWKFNTATNNWTWVSGDSTVNSSGIYGTQGVSDISNKPSARSYSTGWDSNGNDIWIFGGYHSNSSDFEHYNDLWKFNPSISTSIELNKKNTSFNIYPNPFNEKFTIESKKKVSTSITNILGEIIFTVDIEKGVNEVNIPSQPNGIYFIKSENQTYKIVKQ